MGTRRKTPRGPRPDDLRASVLQIGSRSYSLLSFRRELKVEDDLTPAEQQVALAALSGLSNADIARMRGSSPRTVANQLAAIFRKLGVRSRSELAAKSGTRR
jgi:DNA-binding NarL/FixJ family response regulator